MTTTRPGRTLSPTRKPRSRSRKSARRYLRRAALAIAILGAFFLGLCWGLGSAPTSPRQCTDPATHERVIPGDAILNDGQEFVCTDGTLVHVRDYGNAAPAASAQRIGEYRLLPRWARYQKLSTAECGRDHRAIVVYSTTHGGDSAALICYNGKVEAS